MKAFKYKYTVINTIRTQFNENIQVQIYRY